VFTPAPAPTPTPAGHAPAPLPAAFTPTPAGFTPTPAPAPPEFTPVPAPRSPARAASPDRPAPWRPGNAWSLVEAWPADLWPTILTAVAPERPFLDGLAHPADEAVGSGWFARSSAGLTSEAEARAEVTRLVTWMDGLGDIVSRNRCIVLTTAGPGRFAVVQLVHRVPTLASFVQGAFEPGMPPKRCVYMIAQAAVGYMAAASEFARRQIFLPVELDTVTRLDRHTVFTDFLPPEPVEPPAEPAIFRLEARLGDLLGRQRFGTLDMPEVLRELDLLMEGKPQISATLEVIQQLLTGGTT
jgi:hypothetical protein